VVDPTFAEWLRHRALAAGYDIDGERGAQARLAKATGISPTQIGRTLNSQTMPDVQSQLRLARALRVPFSEMLIRSGVAERTDFPDASTAPDRPLDLYEIGEALGILRDDVPILQALVAQLQRRGAMPQPPAG
jgi:transcriptional regulator with XRE-family HTH domain